MKMVWMRYQAVLTVYLREGSRLAPVVLPRLK